MRTRIFLATALLLVGCGGTPGNRGSTTASRRTSLAPSADDRRALSLLPDSVFAVARLNVSAFGSEPALEGIRAAFAEADPTTAATIDAIEAVYVGLGPWIDADRMCFASPWVPAPDGCPELEDDAYAAYYDYADALRGFRFGPGRRVSSFYVLVRTRDPRFCSEVASEGTPDARGLRVVRRSGVAVFDAGDGLCGFAPEALADSLRRADGIVVSHGALELGVSRPRVLADLAISGRHDALREVLTAEEPDDDVHVPTILPLVRMAAPLFRSLESLRFEATSLEVSALHFEGRAEYADAAEARDTKAILEFLVHYAREYGAWMAHTYSDGVPEPIRTYGAVTIEREGASDRTSIPLAAGSFEGVARAILMSNPAFRSHAYEAEDEADVEWSDPDDEGWYQALDDSRALAPQDAYARLEEAGRRIGDDPYGRLLLMRELVARGIETGRFREVDATRRELHERLEDPDDARYSTRLDYYVGGAALAALRNDARSLDAIASEIDDYLGDDTEWPAERFAAIARTIRERLLPMVRRTSAAGRTGSATPYVDRRPTPTTSPGLCALDDALAQGGWDDALAIERFQGPRGSETITGYPYETTGFSEAQLHVRYALAHLGAGRATEALAIVDAALGPEATPNYAERTELTWVRCRVRRFTESDAASLPTCRQAVEFATFTHGPDHPNTARAKVELAEAERGAGHGDVARHLGAEALAALETSTHASHPLRVTARALARGGR